MSRTSRPRLMPPRAFSERLKRRLYGTQPSDHPAVQKVLICHCSGFSIQPEPEDFDNAMLQGPRTDAEHIAIEAWLGECSNLDLTGCVTDGAYSMHALVRAMHANRGEFGHSQGRIRRVNHQCLPEWRTQLKQYDPNPDGGDFDDWNRQVRLRRFLTGEELMPFRSLDQILGPGNYTVTKIEQPASELPEHEDRISPNRRQK